MSRVTVDPESILTTPEETIVPSMVMPLGMPTFPLDMIVDSMRKLGPARPLWLCSVASLKAM